MKFIYLLCLIPFLLQADFPIQCIGKTKITYVDSKEQKDHTVTCYEKVEIDFNENYIQCLTPHHDPLKQSHFHDEFYDLYADQIRATYVQSDSSYILEKLKVYGNVSLVQKKRSKKSGSIEYQYALADQLDYDYKSDKIILKAKEDTKVLYFDTENNYKVAAEEILIAQKSDTAQPFVQGTGKVRFTFEENELEKLKKHFFGKGKDQK